MSSHDVLIIGGGLAGLTAAAALSSSDLSVVVIDQSSDLGGRLAVLECEGFRLDAGMHCFHYGDAGVTGALRESLGIELSSLESGDPGYILRGKDRLPVPTESGGNPDDVPGFSENEAERINAWLGLLMNDDPDQWRKKTVAERMAEAGLSDDELIRDYAGALCLTLLGRGVEETSAGLLISHARAAGHPGFHVSSIEGGPGSLIESLSGLLDRDRVKLILGDVVQEIEISDGRVDKVVASSEEFIPSVVIYTGELSRLPDLATIDGLSGAHSRKLARQKGVAGVALELCQSTRVSEISGVMLDPAEAIVGRFPSNLDPSLAPEGAQISSWLALLDPEDLADKKTTSAHIKRLKRVIKRQFPDIFDNVIIERLRVLPAVATVAPVPKQVEKKSKVTVPGVENLLVAGDGLLGGGVLSGAAVSSALLAAEKTRKLLS